MKAMTWRWMAGWVMGAAMLGGCGHKAKLPSDPKLAEAQKAPKVITAPGPEYGGSTRPFQGIPSIERAKNGRLWAVWYGGGKTENHENYVMLVTSGDDGRTWSDVKVVIDPDGNGPVRAYDPEIWHDPQGRMWVFWAQSYEWFDGRSGTWAMVSSNSGDENPKWSKPRRIANGIMMCKPTVTKSGEWLMPIAVWNQSKDPEMAAEKFSSVFVSKDKGRTFTRRGGADVAERTFDEHMVVERNDGSLWMLVRTKYGIGQSVSMDGGKTWSKGEPTGIRHPSARFWITRLKSGKLLMVRHAPPGPKLTRSHLMAFVSEDDGKSWTGGLMLDERNGVSYPDGVQAPDGSIYVIYDYNRTKEKQILMAKFTEADVSAGKASEGTRLQVVVNQATGEMPK